MSHMISGDISLHVTGVLEWDMDQGFYIWKDGINIPCSDLLTPFLSKEVDFHISSGSLHMISDKLSDIT